MKNILDLLESIWTNHKEIVLTGIITCLGTLFVVFIRRIAGLFKDTTIWFGKRLGGVFAYKSFINSYLDWMVLENQDLNLTGVIGTGPKPKLEQVFISLTMSGQMGSPEKKKDTGRFSKIIRRILGLGGKSEEVSREATKQQNRTFYDEKEFSKVGAFFERNQGITEFSLLALILALWVGIFIYVPAYILFWSSTNSNWLFVLAGIIFGIAIYLLVGLLSLMNFEKVSLAISIIGLSPYVAIGIFLFRLNDPLSNKVLFTVIGTILGLIAIAIIRRVSNKDEDGEELFTKNLRQIFVQHNHIAILGKPGAGKSTLVQFIALTFARAKAGDRKLRRTNIVKQKLGLDTWYFPILIPLRKVAKHLIEEDTDGSTNLLIEIWKDKILPSDIRADLPDGLIQRLLKQNRCIILLDGLDEVADDDEFKIVAKEIRGFSSRYNGNKFILTSRFAGWRGGVGSAFQEYELDDLSDKQILSFINSWYHAIEENRIVGGVQNESESERTQRFRIARSKANNLIDAFENIEGISHLAKNPLLLSLICFVHYNQALPKERLSLYLECSKLLLMQWDLEKGIVIDDTDLTLKQKEAIMQEIAFSMHTGKIGTGAGSREVSSREIVPLLEEKLRQFRLQPQNAQSLFQKLIDRSGLIVCIEKYSDRYSFSHLTFQEFYTAKYIFDNQLNILSSFLEQSAEQLTGWWKEVMLLYVSMMGDPSTFVEKLCEQEHAIDDIAKKRVQVAAQCLIQSVQVLNEQVEEKIVSRLLEIRLTDFSEKKDNHLAVDLLRSYLLEFSSKKEYYHYSINSTVKWLREKGDVGSIFNKLWDISKSPDVDLTREAMLAISDLMDNNDLPPQISPEVILDRFDNADEQIKSYIVSIACKSPVLLANRKLLENILLYMLRLLDKGFVSDVYYYSGSRLASYSRFGAVDETIPHVFRNLLAQLPQIPYQHHSDKQWVLDQLWDTFDKLVDSERRGIRSIRFDSDDFTPNTASAIIALSDEKEKHIYISQFLGMLKLGSETKQQLAVRVIEILMRENTNKYLTDELMSTLESPYPSVRMSALDELCKCEFSKEQAENIFAALEKHLRPHSFRRTMRLRLRKLFTGKGYIGADHREKTRLIRFLSSLGVKEDKELEILIIELLEKTKNKSTSDIPTEHLFEVLSGFSGELSVDVTNKILDLYFHDIDELLQDDRLIFLDEDMRDSVMQLVDRFSLTAKRQMEANFLERIEKANSERTIFFLLMTLKKLWKAFSSQEMGTISMELTNKIREFVKNKNWELSNLAFELIMIRGLI